jgi:hypothetical protein
MQVAGVAICKSQDEVVNNFAGTEVGSVPMAELGAKVLVFGDEGNAEDAHGAGKMLRT